MFIKIKGSFNQTIEHSLLTNFLVNINSIDTVQILSHPVPNQHDTIIRTNVGIIYTSDEVVKLIYERMSKPFNELIPEKSYRDPVLPQDMDGFAEFSDDGLLWVEGWLLGCISGKDFKWNGRFVHGTAFYKYCRIEVKT